MPPVFLYLFGQLIHIARITLTIFLLFHWCCVDLANIISRLLFLNLGLIFSYQCFELLSHFVISDVVHYAGQSLLALPIN